MADVWGSTNLYILFGTLRHSVIAAPLTEVQLLPDPAALGSISTVVQQQGRGRLRVKARLYVSVYSNYDAFVADINAGTQRTLSLDNTGISATYMIESLGEPEFIHDNVKFAGIIFFDIVWIEV